MTVRYHIEEDARVTLKKINKALKERRYDSTLHKGEGYFYFEGNEADCFKEQGVYVHKLNELSLEEWVAEFEQKMSISYK